MNDPSNDAQSAQHRRAAAALLRLMTSVVRSGTRDIGVTASLTLVTLDFSGPRRITELATAEGVSQPAMSSVVAGLERAGLVQRRRDPSDRRVVLVALTRDGEDYLYRRRESGVEMLAKLIECLPGDDGQTLLSAVPVIERLNDQAMAQRFSS
jgi:DNA-binding MarR family transcriptional regulator